MRKNYSFSKISSPLREHALKIKSKWREAVTGDEKKRVRDLIKENAVKIKSKWRKVVTGDEKKRIRDLIKEKESEPVYIKFFDKVGFTLGVLNIAVCQYFLLNYPNVFWVWYSAVIPIIMSARYFHYRSLEWHYFMFDFCYFTIACTFVHLFIIKSTVLFKILFIFANGPLPTAIVVWKNSLVFHDFDKITSVYIHILPSMLFYSEHWHGNEPLQWMPTPSPTALSCPSLSDPSSKVDLQITDFVFAALLYLFWQICYFVKTEVVDKDLLDQQPQILTSLRWLSADTKNTLAKAVLKLCRKLGIFRPEEVYNSKSTKTKIVFISSQFLYTILTFLPTPILYYSKSCHMVYIILIFACSVYNGASFYMDVFSKRYQDQFRDKPSTAQVKSSPKSFPSKSPSKNSLRSMSTEAAADGSSSGGLDEDCNDQFDKIDDVLDIDT